jgi:hypothetical protein
MRLFFNFLSFIATLLFFTNNIFAQTYSVADCKTDFQFIKKVIQQMHGGLYQGVSVADFEKKMVDFEKKITKPMKAHDFFRFLTNGFMGLDFDHTSISLPEEYFKDLLLRNSFFPLPLYFMQGKARLDYDFLEIPVGAEITHINDEKITNLVAKFLNQDIKEVEKGENSTINFRTLEENFSIWYFLEYGEKPFFEVQYTDFETKKSNKLRINSVNSRALNGRKLSLLSKKSERYKEDIHYIYIDSVKTLLVTLNTFKADSIKFVEMWDRIAEGTEGIKNFVLDLRQNGGGWMILGEVLYSYFIDKPHKNTLNEEIRSRTIAEKEQVLKINGYPARKEDIEYAENYLKNDFSEKPNQKGSFSNTKKSGTISEIKPRKKTIKSNIYILIGGNTYSTAVSFGRFMYNNTERNITFVGEETGSSYYGHTANILLSYKLPKTNIVIELPLVQVDFPTIKKDIPKKRGIIPQMKVSQNIEDFMKGEDSVLKELFKKLK